MVFNNRISFPEFFNLAVSYNIIYYFFTKFFTDNHLYMGDRKLVPLNTDKRFLSGINKRGSSDINADLKNNKNTPSNNKASGSINAAKIKVLNPKTSIEAINNKNISPMDRVTIQNKGDNLKQLTTKLGLLEKSGKRNTIEYKGRTN